MSDNNKLKMFYNKAQQIRELSESGEKDLEKYKSVLDSLFINPSDILKYVPLSVAPGLNMLQSDLDECQRMLDKYPDADTTKMMCGMTYLYENLYEYLKCYHVGTLLDFRISASQFRGKIFLNLSNDRVKGNADERKQKIKEIESRSPFDYSDSKIAATESGKHNLQAFLSQIMKGKCNYSVKESHNGYDASLDYANGYFSELNFNTRSICVPDFPKYVEDNVSIVSDLEKYALNLQSSIGYCLENNLHASDECRYAMLGSFFDMCEKLRCNDAYRQAYIQIFCKDRKKNTETKQRVNEIGKNISPSELLRIADKIQSDAMDKLAPYGLSPTISFSTGGMRAEIMPENLEDVQPRKWMGTDEYGFDLYISAKNIRALKSDLKSNGFYLDSYRINARNKTVHDITATYLL